MKHHLRQVVGFQTAGLVVEMLITLMAAVEVCVSFLQVSRMTTVVVLSHGSLPGRQSVGPSPDRLFNILSAQESRSLPTVTLLLQEQPCRSLLQVRCTLILADRDLSGHVYRIIGSNVHGRLAAWKIITFLVQIVDHGRWRDAKF